MLDNMQGKILDVMSAFFLNEFFLRYPGYLITLGVDDKGECICKVTSDKNELLAYGISSDMTSCIDETIVTNFLSAPEIENEIEKYYD
jgi:hypothetical protein